jgi:hypothetical protein
MTTTTRRVTATLTLLLFLAACSTTMRPLAPNELGSVKKNQWLVVEATDGTSVRIKDATSDANRIVGVTNQGERREIPLASIRSVRVESKDATLLYALVPIAAVGFFLAIGAATAPDPPPGESCPFVYVYDGRDLVFEAEPYGAAIAPALQRTEWTPLPHLRVVDGEYRIRIANELEETQYTDEARLVVVDHPEGTQVAADPSGQLHVFRNPAPPLKATDEQGRDLTGVLREADDKAWLAEYGAMNARSRDTLRDPLVLEFAKPAGARTARLLVNGATALWGAQVAREFLALRGRRLPEWYAALDARGPALFAVVAWYAREGLYMLPIEVETAAGWQPRGTLFGSGPFAYKTTAYALDVSDVEGETLIVRLPVPVNFWVLNSVAVDYGEQPPVEAREIQTSTERDARGRETRRLLSATDGDALVMAEKGDHADLAYPAPPARPGQARTVLLRISGHYDIHLPAEGEPQEALLQRVLFEPGYTLRFAFDLHLQRAAQVGQSLGPASSR